MPQIVNQSGAVVGIDSRVDGIPELQSTVVSFSCNSGEQQFVFEADRERGSWALHDDDGTLRGWLADEPHFVPEGDSYHSVVYDCLRKVEGRVRARFEFVWYVHSNRFVVEPYA